MRYSGVFLAVIAFALGLWGWSHVAGDEQPERRTRDGEVAVAVDATVDPLALPLHLPVRLPAGHRWVGETQRDHAGGEVVAVTTAFQSGDGAVVTLCAASRADGGRCRAGVETAEVVDRTVDEYVVVLRPVRGSFGSAELAGFWESVELTSDPARVSWLPPSDTREEEP